MFIANRKPKEAIVALCRVFRNYRANDAEFNIVKKVWSRGRGEIGFIRVYEDRKVLAVNKPFYNRTDERKIGELKRMLGEGWRIVWCEYGYPSYYEDAFSLKFAIDEKERS